MNSFSHCSVSVWRSLQYDFEIPTGIELSSLTGNQKFFVHKFECVMKKLETSIPDRHKNL